mgnify:CR=1 FL=1
MNLLGLLNIYRNFLSRGSGIDRAEICLLSESTGDKIVFPVPPANLPEVQSEQKNDTFESVIGDISTIGLLGLRTVSFEKLLCPSDNSKYPFARGSEGQDIINFINKSRLSDSPFRLIITRSDVTYLNMLAVIDSFSYYLDNTNDYYIDIDFREYRFYNQTTGALES